MSQQKDDTKGTIVLGFGSGGKRPGLFGFDPFVREKSDTIQGAPPLTNKLFGLCCGLLNLYFQHYLMFGGGAQYLLSFFGFRSPFDTKENADHFNQQKQLLFGLLLANEVQAQVGSCLIYFHRAWGALDVSVFTFIVVRGFFFTVFSLTIFIGGGIDTFMGPVGQCALLACVISAMVLERTADWQLADFVKRKVMARNQEPYLPVAGGSANGARICREGLWAWMRHPNHFFFCWYWFLTSPFTGSWIAVVYFLVANHGWIIFQGIPSLESHMVEKYGDEYAQYQREVPALYPLWLCRW